MLNRFSCQQESSQVNRSAASRPQVVSDALVQNGALEAESEGEFDLSIWQEAMNQISKLANPRPQEVSDTMVEQIGQLQSAIRKTQTESIAGNVVLEQGRYAHQFECSCLRAFVRACMRVSVRVS